MSTSEAFAIGCAGLTLTACMAILSKYDVSIEFEKGRLKIVFKQKPSPGEDVRQKEIPEKTIAESPEIPNDIKGSR